MRINKEIVAKLKPCDDGYAWYLKNYSTDLLETLLNVNDTCPNWARWLFIRLMNVKQRRSIAVFAAERVLPIFEKRYPNDDRPRKAIESAKAVIKKDTKANREKAKLAAAADAYAAYAKRKEMQIIIIKQAVKILDKGAKNETI
jgi:hypothetical protein